jgi:hypothetical protein
VIQLASGDKGDQTVTLGAPGISRERQECQKKYYSRKNVSHAIKVNIILEAISKKERGQVDPKKPGFVFRAVFRLFTVCQERVWLKHCIFVLYSGYVSHSDHW